MKEFFNSKSMITPGVAGALVTFLTATLSSQFGLSAKWIALGFSVLLALLILLADQAGSRAARAGVFLLNAAIIFSMSVGTNTSIMAAKSKPIIQSTPPFESAPAEPSPTPFFHSWFDQ
jgi:hypothetical protein